MKHLHTSLKRHRYVREIRLFIFNRGDHELCLDFRTSRWNISTKVQYQNAQSIRMQNGIILHWTQSAIIAVVVYTRNFTIMREIACVRCEIRAAKFLINVDTRHLPRCLIAVYVYTNMEAAICMQNDMWSFSQLVCVMVMCDIHVHVLCRWHRNSEQRYRMQKKVRRLSK